MSSNLPPVGPPSGPPLGPPPFGAPELLDSGAGGRIPPPPPPRGSTGGGGRRKGLILGGSVVGLAAVAGGAFAVYQLAFATGPQPAEALPASTIGYVSVDLDPSGKQKLEALETLKKFPAFEENVDVDSDDDLRATLFEYLQDDGACAGIDFGDDIEPWLGDRFGFAAVDVGDDLAPDSNGIAPVGVVQVKDGDKADEGLKKLLECDGSGDSASGGGSSSSDDPDDEYDDYDDDQDSGPEAGWSIQGDWVVIAETTEIAEAVTDAAQDESLADDDDYQKWTEAAGDAGIVTAYIAPEAGPFISDVLGGFPLGVDYTACASSSGVVPDEPTATASAGPDDDMSDPYDDDSDDDYGDYDDYDDYDEDCTDVQPDPSDDEAASALEGALEDFDGAAVTIRFGDGGLEVESASSVDFLGLEKIYDTEGGDDVVAELPDDTAIAVGLGFEDGWFTAVTDYVESTSGGLFDLEEGLAEIERQTGLQLPEDAETLLGESAAIAVGSDVDFGADDPYGQPLGVKVKGDPDGITAILEKLLDTPELDDEFRDAFTYQSDGGHVVGALSEDWGDELLAGGDLGDTDAYQDVVEDSDDAAAVAFVDFDAGDWLEKAVRADGDDAELLDNLEPLRAAGLSAWTDDDGVSHSVLRVTTN